MGSTNLAIVFAPCFLRPKEMSIANAMYLKTMASHFTCLIDDAHEIFYDPRESCFVDVNCFSYLI